jgi:uncharacterized protein YjbJ (UPF0337 family)
MLDDTVGHPPVSPSRHGTRPWVDPFEIAKGIYRDEEIIMGELTDKIKGNVNEALGKAKQHSDDPETRDEGAAQEIKGKGEQFMGKVKGALGDDI